MSPVHHTRSLVLDARRDPESPRVHNQPLVQDPDGGANVSFEQRSQVQGRTDTEVVSNTSKDTCLAKVVVGVLREDVSVNLV